jgi:hypothetical protein
MAKHQPLFPSVKGTDLKQSFVDVLYYCSMNPFISTRNKHRDISSVGYAVLRLLTIYISSKG